MKIVDFKGAQIVEKLGELESILLVRYPPGVNSFWLNDGVTDFPVLLIMARDDLACLHYMEDENDVGVQSEGGMIDLPGTVTVFSMDGEQTEIDNCAVVPFSLAIAAAKEFLICNRKPTLVQWCEV